MDAVTAVAVCVAVVVVAVAAGAIGRLVSGRRRSGTGRVAAVDVGAARLGERATLVQFSSELCARCPGTHRVLGEIARARPGVVHVDVDLTHRPDLARRFGVLQTPTTLIVDGGGGIRARFAGVVRPAEVERELDSAAAGSAPGVGGGHP